MKVKRGILNLAKRKSVYNGTSIRLSGDFYADTLQVRKMDRRKSIQNAEREKPTTYDTLPSKIIIYHKRKNTELLRQTKTRFINTKPVKGFSIFTLSGK